MSYNICYHKLLSLLLSCYHNEFLVSNTYIGLFEKIMPWLYDYRFSPSYALKYVLVTCSKLSQPDSEIRCSCIYNNLRTSLRRLMLRNIVHYGRISKFWKAIIHILYVNFRYCIWFSKFSWLSWLQCKRPDIWC